MSDKTEMIAIAAAVIFSIAAIIMAAYAISKANKKCEAEIPTLPAGVDVAKVTQQAAAAQAAEMARLAAAAKAGAKKEGFYYYGGCVPPQTKDPVTGLCK